MVNLILNAHPGSTAEVINYPAAGGDSYGSSVRAGVQAVTNQINSFAASCPNTQLVYVGYSQGAQIGDDAFCGGGDPNQGISSTAAPISSSVGAKVKAIIWMGDPRHTPGAPYNVGSSTAPGVSSCVTHGEAVTESEYSLTPDLLARSAAHTRPGSKVTVMQVTRTAATVTTRPHTRIMPVPMARLLSSSLTANSPDHTLSLENH